ncbi:metallophosphoesterase [Actinosynnema sp. NPDC047251]|uniref:Metallophosphoesterase n=1 Tax=Saccharothrix espanaensis (strain ATCC 51144 / DSM 44229 / JCM 9112 / NBRC 15066 / NRRL 15764) TaxID=1179773 RepID=K0JSV6_SACES|nr:metallophosphoesterase [Saccharothrix espanaensis]CCH28961.1 Metallophosphoesterase [Saccharothrix espanaensis DSM 44229]
MRVHVVSDVHGNAEALARAGDGADALVVLGDLVDFVDYYDHGKGILGRVFGAEKVEVFARLRRERMSAETVRYIRSLWDSLDDAAEVVREAVLEQYTELFAAMSAPTYATPGNVDSPELWPRFVRDGVHVLDGESAEIGGLRFGFVGGALIAPGFVRRPGAPWYPYLRTEDEFDAALAGLGPVDVLCTHIPPAVAELTYDVVARRPEWGSAALLDTIRRDRPRWSVFGHVHQPMARRVRVGWTECVNVGHFQRSGTPHVLRW